MLRVDLLTLKTIHHAMTKDKSKNKRETFFVKEGIYL